MKRNVLKSHAESLGCWIVIAALQLGLAPSRVEAQRRGAFELGVDGGASAVFHDIPARNPTEPPTKLLERQLLVDVPLRNVRVGYYITDRLEFEQALFLKAGYRNGEFTGSSQELQVSEIYHFTIDPNSARTYVRLASRLNQFDVGLGFGVKVPTGNRTDLRLELGGARSNSSSTAYFVFGLSFFTK